MTKGVAFGGVEDARSVHVVRTPKCRGSLLSTMIGLELIDIARQGDFTMPQSLAVRSSVTSLKQVEELFNLVAEDGLFQEWFVGLPELSVHEGKEVDHLQNRFLVHRDRGQLTEGSVDRLLVSPLLDLAGFYDPAFVLETEKSVEVTANDGDTLYRGRIDVLVVSRRMWLLVVEEKGTRIDMETALPQMLAYMLACPSRDRPVFGMATNGNAFAFVKMGATSQGSLQYAISDTFVTRSRTNQLTTVLQILKQIKQLIEP